MSVSISKLIKLHKKKAIEDGHIFFITACIKENLTPTFCKIKFPANTKLEIINRTTNGILIQRKHEHYSRANRFRKQQLEMHMQLSNILHQIELDTVIETARETYSIVRYREFNKKLQKLRKLRADKTTKKISLLKQQNLKEHTFFKRFTNLSDIIFTNEEQDMLNKGMKYAPSALNIDKNLLENLAIELECATQNVPNESNLRAELQAFLKNEEQRYNRENIITNRHLNNYTQRKERKTIDNIKEKIKKNKLVIVPADKNAGFVIADRSTYTTKTEEFFTANNITLAKKNPINTYNTKTRNIIRHTTTTIKKFHGYNLAVSNPQSPRLYSLFKLHKPETPIRPIVSAINSPAEKISKFINKVITKDMGYISYFSIKNSIECAKKLQIIQPSPSSKMISFDIVNLYTNIPIDQTLILTKNFIQSKIINEEDINNLMQLLEISTQQNFFKFNEKIYIMANGLPMGSPLSPILANIFIDELEKEIFKLEGAKFIKTWMRYVDDIFCIWEGSNDDLIKFQNEMNSLHPKIKFTTETEINKQLNFLDITITRNQNQFKFGIYRKPTTTDTLIPYNSHHTYSQKSAAFHSLIHRAFNIPLEKEELEKELKIIHQLATMNGYPEKLINKIIEKHKTKQFINNINAIVCNNIIHNNNDPTLANDNIYRKFTFNNKKISYKLKNILKKHKIIPAFKTKTTLKNIFTNGKDKLPHNKKSGVYEIKCFECPAKYIGETSRNIEIRVKEHINNITTSNVGRHLYINGHNKNKIKVKLLYEEDNTFKRKLLENLSIEKMLRKNENIICLNDQVLTNEKPLFKTLEKYNTNIQQITVNRRRRGYIETTTTSEPVVIIDSDNT